MPQVPLVVRHVKFSGWHGQCAHCPCSDRTGSGYTAHATRPQIVLCQTTRPLRATGVPVMHALSLIRGRTAGGTENSLMRLRPLKSRLTQIIECVLAAISLVIFVVAVCFWVDLIRAIGFDHYWPYALASMARPSRTRPAASIYPMR